MRRGRKRAVDADEENRGDSDASSDVRWRAVMIKPLARTLRRDSIQDSIQCAIDARQLADRLSRATHQSSSTNQARRLVAVLVSAMMLVALARVVTRMGSGADRLAMVFRVVAPFNGAQLAFAPIMFILLLDIDRTRLHVDGLRLHNDTRKTYVDIDIGSSGGTCGKQ